MWNQFGTNILVFVAARCVELKRERTALSQLILDAPPTAWAMPEFVRRLTMVREQLPLCEALRARLRLAILNEEDQEIVVQSTQAEIGALMEGYPDDCGYSTEAHSVALAALRSLYHELNGFSTVGQGSPKVSNTTAPDDVLGKFVAERLAEEVEAEAHRSASRRPSWGGSAGAPRLPRAA